jgi:hypothetical protein
MPFRVKAGSNSNVRGGPFHREPRPLMALALKFQGLLSQDTVRNHAQLAELGQVTRTRVCQILKLTNLAPTIQEVAAGERCESAK